MGYINSGLLFIFKIVMDFCQTLTIINCEYFLLAISYAVVEYNK
jgi:hypothetical protein